LDPITTQSSRHDGASPAGYQRDGDSSPRSDGRVAGSANGSASWRFSSPYEWMDRVQSGFTPLIITCALNGGVQGKEANPNLPETPEEIARSAEAAYNAGASVVHVHIRSPENWSETSGDPEFNMTVNALIRERCPEIIINNTTGGGPSTTMDQRFAMLDAMPEMASLNLGPDMSRFQVKERPAAFDHPHPEQVFDVCLPFTYGIIEELAAGMLERSIKPELELYHSGQYWVARELIQKQLIQPPYVHQFVMGYQTSAFPTPENVCRLVAELPDGSIFFVCGIGPFQLPMTTLSIVLGGHVRVGLEDNIYYRRGQRLRGNGEAVERTVRIARELNREVAAPAQAREMLGLPATPSRYPDSSVAEGATA
jgi:3-keto-5-aminohexanoate cleavage enzyme